MSDLNLRPDLIELVRINECVYNPRHTHYKSKLVKTMAWENISAKLNIDVQRARELWRSLRDGYIRYKKALRNGKSSVYSWSEHLSFLDEVLEPKDDVSQEDSQQPVFCSEDVYAKVTEGSPEKIEFWEEGSAASSPRPEYKIIDERPRSRKRKADTIDKVIDYLKSKKNKEHDAVDYLFMSYAKTFKSLTARKQAILKVTLAKMFAEAEFGDLSGETFNDK